MPTRRATNLKIRDATAADAAEIEAVHQASREAAFEGRLPLDVVNSMDRAERLERWHAWLADPGISTLVGVENGTVRGFGTLKATLDGDLDPRRVAEMPTLYVDPGSWGRGFGHDLCRAVEARALELGYEELTLWVLEVNAGARRFYTAVGFRHDGVTKMDAGSIPAPVLAMRYRKTLRRTVG